ncbi:MAG TPA: hypothetical protein VLK82_14625 [Candidatus Tectomicrobia bacterium]|nr:hypothetical protein [Candidatus Tectomicrobia bacterium]
MKAADYKKILALLAELIEHLPRAKPPAKPPPASPLSAPAEALEHRAYIKGDMPLCCPMHERQLEQSVRRPRPSIVVRPLEDLLRPPPRIPSPTGDAARYIQERLGDRRA